MEPATDRRSRERRRRTGLQKHIGIHVDESDTDQDAQCQKGPRENCVQMTGRSTFISARGPRANGDSALAQEQRLPYCPRGRMEAEWRSMSRTSGEYRVSGRR